ncbi:hypothetical protein [Thermostichus vulcanus]|uniref:Uncharacterized protein n=1 Tax=Thermostichus vulcanus str. 'Rupite' TaxID=2813851 RepID=A0ABT0CBA1_THEVL|nr:hypothetical protein [Thermostichus vulcanus]MCJ2543043.1 hypothetical protein [Thermostichus vulcanus str. 'Rupite']
MGSPNLPQALQATFEQLGVPKPAFSWRADPWLSFPWSVQVGSWPSGSILYGEADAPEIEWARALCQLRLSHPPIPVAYPRDPETASAEVLTYAWCLNRILQGVVLDRALEQLGYDANESKRLTQEQLMAQSEQIPDYIKALLLLELLYRGIDIAWQKELQAACGDDEMRAAHQLNMACIRPEDPERTLLQVHHFGLRISGSQEEQLRAGLQIQLSDGRQV